MLNDEKHTPEREQDDGFAGRILRAVIFIYLFLAKGNQTA